MPKKGLPIPAEETQSEEYKRGWQDGYETRNKELKELEDKGKEKEKGEKIDIQYYQKQA